MRIPVLAAGVLVALAFLSGTRYGETREKSKVTPLLQTALHADFVPGREVLVDLVEIPPNGRLDRHWHPGEEFHYYLDGEPEIVLEGRAPLHPQPGTAGHVPFKTLHRAGAGPAGARILVFRVHASGEPWRYLEHEAEPPDAVRK